MKPLKKMKGWFHDEPTLPGVVAAAYPVPSDPENPWQWHITVDGYLTSFGADTDRERAYGALSDAFDAALKR